jgi:anthranilate synthase component I
LFSLESVEGGEVWALYSFLGADPLMVLTAKSGRLTLRSLSIGKETTGS